MNTTPAILYKKIENVREAGATFLGATHSGGVPLQSHRQFLRLAESDQMTAGHLVGRDPETFPCYASLEISRKEPVIARNQHASRHRRPALEGARRSENGI